MNSVLSTVIKTEVFQTVTDVMTLFSTIVKCLRKFDFHQTIRSLPLPIVT